MKTHLANQEAKSDPNTQISHRIVLGFVEVAGYYHHLCQSLRELGHQADYIPTKSHAFAYPVENIPHIALKWLNQINEHNLPKWLNLLLLPFKLILRIWILCWLIPRYDVFIIGYHSHLLYHLEWPLLKRLGKRLIFVYHGTDCRPPFLDGIEESLPLNKKIKLIKRKKRLIARIERSAHWIVNHSATGIYHQRSFAQFLKIGIPCRVPEAVKTVSLEPPQDLQNTVRIVHSPSNSKIKGTVQIRAAIENLKAKGHAIDWIEIINKPNLEVWQCLADCDFVVDQIYSDTPLAGFATEAALLGKPAIVGGYYSEFVTQEFAPDDIPPSYFCLPNQIETAIETLILNPELRLQLGKRAQEFVTSRWHPNEVARRFVSLIEDQVPADWIANPSSFTYPWGCGLSKERILEQVKELVSAASSSSLGIDDKPQLKQALIQLIKLPSSKNTVKQ